MCLAIRNLIFHNIFILFVVSGEVPVDAVVSTKSGLLFEKRIVHKYIADGGKCPSTGEDINEFDLIEVKASKTVRPRSIAGNSIPSMITNFQNEWDEVMLETFNLKQHLDATRKELSQALYQHDAACRVIARLIKERDDARALLSARLSGEAPPAPTGARVSSSEMEVSAPESESVDVESPTSALGSTVVDAINAKCAELSSTRKGRKASEIAGLAPKDKVISDGYVTGASHTPHKSDKPGVTCLAVGPIGAENRHILTGGVDKTALLIDASTGSVINKLNGHTKKVSVVAFHPSYTGTHADTDRLFTASADSTVKIWKPTTERNKRVYKDAYTFKHHTGEVTGLAVHPTGSYSVSLSKDSSWAFLDMEVCKVLTQMTTTDGAYSCGAFHPDGLILATGCENSSVNIYDVRDQKRVVAFDDAHQGQTINALTFSENGYIGCVKIWDLRKLKSTKTMESKDI